MLEKKNLPILVLERLASLHLSSYAHVVHTTAKQVISRRRKNEKVKMSKNEKMHVQSMQKYCFLLSNMQICGVFVAVVVVVA